MRAVAYKVSRPIDDREALVDVDLPRPEPRGRDLLVEVKAISVNPVDTKVRVRAQPPEGEWKVLGWDVAGVVAGVGPEARRFKAGDAVYYSGEFTRPGANAEFHAVDERIVGTKPRTLDWAQAAALPLTAVTAWETLFDRLDVKRPVPGATGILIVGGAGGVGSIAVQLARQLTGLTVIATASRPETGEWVKDLGAHHVLDHSRPLSEEIAAAGLAAPGFVFATTHTDAHLAEIVKLIAPQGRLAVIDDPATLDILPFKRKSVSVHWEFMFTRSLFATADVDEQGAVLDEVSRLVDAGTLRTTLTERFGAINAETLRRAHALIESGRARGKIVLEGFSA
ncbi:zinc-binding alcohol dehydrogenase family protein [Shumkonia mesophila]|uniref:zinc-binding alcohol dehydrogenase family protein n=1 Tax=Shumkonia mesophila TaxID=2838854 RepID=UPI002934CA5C|nr:zinc-binding alcohol dehydrogenase family protein [Shumkonia mesophila]